jgi:1-acyl-sn-glycerol-3-phosphate acyltransferase
LSPVIAEWKHSVHWGETRRQHHARTVQFMATAVRRLRELLPPGDTPDLSQLLPRRPFGSAAMNGPAAEPSPGPLTGAVRLTTVPLRRLWLDVEFEGLANVPGHGGVIIAANHLSFIDSGLIMFGLHRPVSFLGKAEYLNSPVSRHLFPAVGMIPVDRSGKGVVNSLRIAQGRIEDGGVVGLFPEGTRSRSGLLHRGHTGVAHLALRTGAPIVPAGIIGTDTALPPGRTIPLRRAAITIRFGAPIGPPPRTDGRYTSTDRRALTDEVMASIAALSGQGVVDSYAPIPGMSGEPESEAPVAGASR